MINFAAPEKPSYDVIIIGGAMYGSAVAWFLISNPDFDGSVLVVEMDPTYEFSSTAHTNSCIRQQFSQKINVQISQFAADYLRNFREYFDGDERVPEITLNSFGYMYLAGDQQFAKKLENAQKIQREMGAGTQHMTSEEIHEKYPFYNLADIVAGNHNLIDEGYFDGNTLFEWWRRGARENGVEFCTNRVVSMGLENEKISTVILETGEGIRCGHVVNASGPRAALTAGFAGIKIPVEPRKRFTFVFDAERPLGRDLPLTIDPSGVHMRTDGHFYLAGCQPEVDPAVDPDDFEMDHDIWENKVWPIIAHRIPQFEALKLVRSWAGHYAFNTFDQNAIVGPHCEVRNFLFANGFSGHGFQQSPAIARGLAEWIIYGEYRSLDLCPLSFARIENAQPFKEDAVI